MEHLTTIEKLKELTECLEKNKINYSVFAGFAFDGLRGKITRNHRDIDILVLKKDFDKIKKILESLDYDYEIINERLRATRKDGAKVDLEMVSIQRNEIIISGKYKLTKIPLELFKKAQKGRIGNLAFNVASNEILKLFLQYDQKGNDKEFLEKMPIDNVLFNKIKRETKN